MWGAGAVEQARSISWPDGIKGDLNQALVFQLALTPLMLVVFINSCIVIYCTMLCIEQTILLQDVRPSVCLSHAGILSKRFNISSNMFLPPGI